MATGMYRYATLEDLADALAPLLADRLNGGSESNGAEDTADPWGSDQGASSGRSAGRSGSSKGSSGNRNSGGSRSGGNRSSGGSRSRSGSNRQAWPSSGEAEDQFGRRWFFDEPDAPNCLCRVPEVAGRVEGTSQAGNDYNVWACPKGYSGDTYKTRCKLWDYVDQD